MENTAKLKAELEHEYLGKVASESLKKEIEATFPNKEIKFRPYGAIETAILRTNRIKFYFDGDNRIVDIVVNP